MYIPKRYGETKTQNCPFCDAKAITVNEQNVPVCLKHKYYKLDSMKCVCGGWLDLKDGKFGPYFFCINCGNVNFKKAMEFNAGMNPTIPSNKNDSSKKDEPIKRTPTETFIRSDELDF